MLATSKRTGSSTTYRERVRPPLWLSCATRFPPVQAVFGPRARPVWRFVHVAGGQRKERVGMHASVHLRGRRRHRGRSVREVRAVLVRRGAPRTQSLSEKLAVLPGRFESGQRPARIQGNPSAPTSGDLDEFSESPSSKRILRFSGWRLVAGSEGAPGLCWNCDRPQPQIATLDLRASGAYG